MLQSTRDGLSSEEAARRLSEHGPNVIVESARRSWLELLGAQFLDVPILVLLGAAAISAVIGDAVDTVVILAIVVLNAVIGFSQEWRAERALAALKAMTASTAMVLRDRKLVSLPARELVPGDVVHLDAGRVVPADLRLIEGAALRTNEAALTGESVPVDKAPATIDEPDLAVGDRSNLLHKGTYVTRGRAVGVVVATGMKTEFGRIAALLRGVRAAQTPLQLGLARSAASSPRPWSDLRDRVRDRRTARRALAADVDDRAQPGGSCDPGGTPGRRHRLACAGCAPHGCAARVDPAIAGSRDAGFRDLHLCRQDRHAHRQRNARPPRIGRKARRSRCPPTVRHSGRCCGRWR